MSSPELTYDEVVEARRPAVCKTMAAGEDRADHAVYREWRYEDGQVWITHRDDDRVYSMRLAAPHELPWSGWHHEDRCDCRYCAERRMGHESVLEPDDDGHEAER